MDVIIGGSGFVGQELMRQLQTKGRDVLLADIQAPKNGAKCPFHQIDITDRTSLMGLKLGPDNTVYHLAARLLVPIVRRREREKYFYEVNFEGTKNVLEHMRESGCFRMVYYTTDMVYGHALATPRAEDHPIEPLGPYGESKRKSEQLCKYYRESGFQISIFRPRLIIGPGRLGILSSLFNLIRLGLPVPLIGNGNNHYQFISVFDCAEAAICAVERGVPNGEYNLGSIDPPTVRTLLRSLIERVGSRSILLPTPAPLTKFALASLDHMGLPLLDPEQYLIADETCILSTQKAQTELGWRPKFSDAEMLSAAYDDFLRTRETVGSA